MILFLLIDQFERINGKSSEMDVIAPWYLKRSWKLMTTQKPGHDAYSSFICDCQDVEDALRWVDGQIHSISLGNGILSVLKRYELWSH